MSNEAAIAELNERKLIVQKRAGSLSHTQMEGVVRVSQVLLDAFSVFVASFLAYKLHFTYGLGQDELAVAAARAELAFSYQQLFLALPVLFGLFALGQGLYQGSFGSRMEELTRVTRSTGVMMLTLLSVLFFYREYSYSRSYILILCILLPLTVGGARWIFSTIINKLHARGYGNRRVIFVGSGDLARFVYSKLLRDPQAGYTAVGYVQSQGPDELSHFLPKLGKLLSFKSILEKQEVDEVIVALPASHQQECQTIIRQAVDGGVAVRLLPDVYQFIPEAMSLEVIRGVHVMSPKRSGLTGINSALKRTMDIVLAASFLVVLSPFFALLALIIWLEDKGPVFFSQDRVGQGGKVFKIHKFRSMQVDAETATGPVWAKENDPRTTKVGRLLRHLSLDELPQFWNVLKGEMSFIGPRPERPPFVDEFASQVENYTNRHDVKPGISGWAQVNGLRGNTSIHERTRYDLFYKDHWSWALEFRIYFQTLWELILRRNAY